MNLQVIVAGLKSAKARALLQQARGANYAQMWALSDIVDVGEWAEQLADLLRGVAVAVRGDCMDVESSVERLPDEIVRQRHEAEEWADHLDGRLESAMSALREIQKYAANDAPRAGDGSGPEPEPWWTFWCLASEGLREASLAPEAVDDAEEPDAAWMDAAISGRLRAADSPSVDSL